MVLGNSKYDRTDGMAQPDKKGFLMILDRIALLLLIVGGINWGSLGLFRFDIVAWIFGGQGAIVSRIIYVLVGISALWCISLLFRERESVVEASRH